MSKTERKTTLLKALAGRARFEEEDSDAWHRAWQRKLVPEIDIEKLSEDGAFTSFLSTLATHLHAAKNLVTFPFPNEDFFRKFSIVAGEETLPISKAQRAFALENLLVRHSRLFITVQDFIDTIVHLLSSTMSQRAHLLLFFTEWQLGAQDAGWCRKRCFGSHSGECSAHSFAAESEGLHQPWRRGVRRLPTSPFVFLASLSIPSFD